MRAKPLSNILAIILSLYRDVMDRKGSRWRINEQRNNLTTMRAHGVKKHKHFCRSCCLSPNLSQRNGASANSWRESSGLYESYIPTPHQTSYLAYCENEVEEKTIL